MSWRDSNWLYCDLFFDAVWTWIEGGLLVQLPAHCQEEPLKGKTTFPVPSPYGGTVNTARFVLRLFLG